MNSLTPRLELDLDAFQAFETTGWEGNAERYDQFFGPITSQIADALLAAAGVGPGIRLLEIASGPGYVAGRAATLGADVIGTDIAGAMVALASRRYPGIEFRQADAQDLPFAEGSFNAIVGNFVLPHLSRHLQAIQECARVLEPSGTIALSMWDVPEHNRLLGVLTDAVSELGVTVPGEIPVGPPFFRYSEDHALTGLLRSAEFERINITRIQFRRRFASSDALWDGLIGGTVRMSALVKGHTQAVRSQLRTAFDHHVAQYANEAGLDIPVSVKVVSGETVGR